MPLPTRNVDESLEEFLARCMADSVMVQEFPDEAQRRAVCQRQAKITADATGTLKLVSEPGAIRIEASADALEGQDPEKPRLPRFSMVAYTGGPMRIGGWRHPVIVDLAGLAVPSQNRPIRFGHDMQSGVGHTDAIQIDAGRLLATGVVSRDTVAAREIVASARNGFPWQASLAASVEEFEFIKPSQTALVNGREFSGPVNVVRRSTLGEISFVDLGADGQTTASVAAISTPHTQEESHVPDSITMGADSQSSATSEGVGAATAVPPAASPAPAPAAPAPASEQAGRASAVAAVEAIRAAAAAESARIAAVRQVCAGAHPRDRGPRNPRGLGPDADRTGDHPRRPPDGTGRACPA